MLPFPPSLPVFRVLVTGWQLGEILADFQKVEEGKLGRVALGNGHLGRTLGTRALDLNHWSLWVAASPSPSLCAGPRVGLNFFFMGCGSTRINTFLQSP